MRLSTYLGDRPFWKSTLRLALPIALQNVLTSSFQIVGQHTKSFCRILTL